MKVTEKVSVPREVFYQTLLSLFSQQYQAATGQDLLPHQLKQGLTYRQTFGKHQEQSVQVVVDELTPHQAYVVSISSNRGLQRLAYLLEEDKDGSLVTYEEDYLPDGVFNKWNYKLMLPLMKKSLEKRMRLQIQKIAEFAHADRA